MTNRIIYAIANLAFIVLIAVYAASNDTVPLMYLAALFALCSTSILVEKKYNGPYTVLCLFLAIYFIFFGLQDVGATLDGRLFPAGGGLPTSVETVILVGGVLAVLGYVIAARALRPRKALTPTRESSEALVIIVGLVLWALGSWASWIWYVDLITDASNAATRKGLGSITSLQTTLLMLGQLAKPLGTLMLIYAHAVYKRAWLLPIVIAIVGFQVVFGFVIDVKGEAMIGIVLVIVTRVLVSAKMPKAWLGIGAVFIVLMFPVFMAHRITSGERGTDHADTAADLGKSLARAIEWAQRDEASGKRRAISFFERASLKGSVTTIVNKTGESVPYREGYTLTPLITAFVPRIIWPDKPNVAAGQLMNADFHISIYRETYISSSHIGELYWNFGWTGVLIGMPVIGLILGTVGARANLADRVSLTRVLITLVTVRYLVMGFEGNIGISYVNWVRSLAAIGLLHLLLNQRRAHSHEEELAPAAQMRTVSVP